MHVFEQRSYKGKGVLKEMNLATRYRKGRRRLTERPRYCSERHEVRLNWLLLLASVINSSTATRSLKPCILLLGDLKSHRKYIFNS